MVELEQKFTEPTQDNVKVGDFLVEKTLLNMRIFPITEVNPRYIAAQMPDKSGEYINKFYQDALVLKKDGTYLIGESVYEDWVLAKNRTSRKVQSTTQSTEHPFWEWLKKSLPFP